MKIFKDRQSAGKLLADKLKDTEADIILAIPRGGVVVAKEIANKLNLPLDVIVTRKIGAPNQKELALGAIDPDGEVVWDNQLLSQLEFKISNLKFQIDNGMKEIKRRERLYRKGKEPLNVQNKAVILVDDGIATGATVLSAIRYLKGNEVDEVILAVPVASKESLVNIKHEVDEMVVLYIPDQLMAVGQFYQNFEPVSDEEVVNLLV